MNINKTKLVTALLFTIASYSQAVTTIDWTSSMETVKTTSSNKLLEVKASSLTFETRLFELDFNLEYIFDTEGKLDHVLYYRAFLPTIANCVEQYNNIKGEVEKQHGKAKTVENIYNSKIETSADDLCAYVATGEYKLETDWQGKPENANLVMSTWKGTPYIGLSYSQAKH